MMISYPHRAGADNLGSLPLSSSVRVRLYLATIFLLLEKRILKDRAATCCSLFLTALYSQSTYHDDDPGAADVFIKTGTLSQHVGRSIVGRAGCTINVPLKI